MHKYMLELVEFFKNRINGYAITDYEEENVITVLFENDEDKFTVSIDSYNNSITVDDKKIDLSKESLATSIHIVYKTVIDRVNKNILH